MAICDCCKQGFHTACFGMHTVPDAVQRLQVLQHLLVVQHIITESPRIITLVVQQPESATTHKGCIWVTW